MRSCFLSILVLPVSAVMAAGNGAGITYVAPPGGEGAASVALGVALSGGISSMEVNPALLAWEGARTSSILQISTSESDLLPVLHVEDAPEDYPLPSWKVLGAKVTPNVRVVWTSSEIEGRSYRGGSSVRDGQSRVAWSLCL